MSFHRPAALSHQPLVALLVAAAALGHGAAAQAEVNFSLGVGGPVYYEPAPVYQAPPPAYYQPPPPVYYPPPAYYRPPPPAYYAPPPRGYYGGPPPVSRPRLSDMQQRALDNCVLLAPREQPRCRATVLSTAR